MKTYQQFCVSMICVFALVACSQKVSNLNSVTPIAQADFANAQQAYSKGDFLNAATWMFRAAEQGHPEAQHYLGLMFDTGRGVPQNFVSSYMWFSLAETNGSSASHNLKHNMARSMEPEQLAEAQIRAERCLRSKYQEC